MSESLAVSTLKSYTRYWDAFTQFVTDVLGQPVIMPISPMLVAMYIAKLESFNLQASTIQGMLCGIAFAHKIRNMEDPSSSFLVKKLIRALQKKPKSADPRRPITRALLARFVKAWRHLAKSWYDFVLYATVFVVAYHGALRISEYTAQKDTKHNVLYDSMSKVWQGGKLTGYVFHWLTYKHSKEKPFTLHLTRYNDMVCPVAWVSDYLALRGARKGPFFVKEDGKPITGEDVGGVLKDVAKFLDLPTKSFTSHSFRIGKENYNK